MSANSLMRNRCTITRNDETWVGGKTTLGPVDIATDVRCLLQEGRGTVGYGQKGAELRYDAMIFFRTGQDVRADDVDDEPDIITMTKPSAGKLLCMKVGDESGFANHRTAYCRRVPSKSTT